MIVAYLVAALTVTAVTVTAFAVAWHQAAEHPVTDLRRRQVTDVAERYGVHDPRPSGVPDTPRSRAGDDDVLDDL